MDNFGVYILSRLFTVRSGVGKTIKVYVINIIYDK